MEIQRYFEEYKKHSPREFYEWLSKGEVMEVRFLSNFKGEKFKDWDIIKELAEKFDLEYRYNSLFIKSFNDLKNILLDKYYFGNKQYPLTRLYNIFISVNPKRKVYTKSKNGLLRKSYYGGIAGTSKIQNILCDIEHIGDREGNATEKMIEECIHGAKYLVTQLELESYYINVSGNGVHLLFDLEEPIEVPIPNFVEFDDKVKYQLKEEPIYSVIKNYNHFIEKLNKMLKEYNPRLKVDEGAKDLSRIFRPPGSWNVKQGKAARAVGTVYKFNKINKGINLKYLAAKPLLNKSLLNNRKVKAKSSKYRFTAIDIQESPLYKLMISQNLPSTLSRNHYLEQSFARLLRDNDLNITDIPDLISNMDLAQMKNVQVDPDYLDDDEPFNPETVNTYCYTCKLDFIYPVMEDVPNITDGFITEEHFNNLNAYSEATILLMSLQGYGKKPQNYFELKTHIRELIDKYERSTVFFQLKKELKEEWEYLFSNKIIQQIMNKTRRREDEY